MAKYYVADAGVRCGRMSKFCHLRPERTPADIQRSVGISVVWLIHPSTGYRYIVLAYGEQYYSDLFYSDV